jgi:hypothetical protein
MYMSLIIEVPRLDTGLHLHLPYVNKLLLGSKLKVGSVQIKMFCVIYYMDKLGKSNLVASSNEIRTA